MATAQDEQYDLLLLVDATASMKSYLRSLRTSLPQIISTSALTGCFSRIGVLAYRDYDCSTRAMLREWSGWVDAGADPVEQTMLTDFARDLDHSRGDSWDEALKTGLARAYSVMREDATTILLVYTDAPPHTEAFAELGYSRAGYDEEQSNLSQKGSFRGCGNDFRDWASCGRTLASEHGKRVQTFCLTHCGMDFVGCCTYLSAMTGGANLELTDLSPEAISRTTVGLLLAWMQVQKVDPHAKPSPFAAKLVSYATEDRMRDIATETDAHAVKFFSIASLEIQRDPPPPPND